MSRDARCEIFFDYVSPFPYFLNEYILKHDVEKRYDLSIEWTPVFLGGLHPDTQHTPLNATDPRRMAYSAVEVQRYSRELSVPYAGALFRPIPALRAALVAKHQGRFREFHTELYRRVQGQGKTPDDPLLSDTMRFAGGDGDALLTQMQAPAIKQELIDNGVRASALQVFGVPFAIHEGEPFWGYSHFPYLLRKLDQAR